MKYKIQEVIEFVTKYISLSSGDLVTMNLPELILNGQFGGGIAKEGDKVKFELQHFGCLENTVRNCAMYL